MSTPTKADVRRWFDAHLGQTIGTHQTTRTGSTWEPGPRTLARKGASRWTLDGSTVELTATHVPVSVESDHVTIEWQDGDGNRINVTTYSVAT